jgi:hypothetical protein
MRADGLKIAPSTFVATAGLCTALLLLALCLSACGKGDEGASVSSAATTGPAPLRVSGGGSAEFRVQGGDNSIQEYGTEAGAAELTAAAKVLHSYLVARAENKWGLACTYLASRQVSQLAQLAASAPQLEGNGCGAALAVALAGAVSGPAARELTVVDAASLRSRGGQSFLLYHGAGNTDYFASMTMQDGLWRVAALSPTAFP